MAHYPSRLREKHLCSSVVQRINTFTIFSGRGPGLEGGGGHGRPHDDHSELARGDLCDTKRRGRWGHFGPGTRHVTAWWSGPCDIPIQPY